MRYIILSLIALFAFSSCEDSTEVVAKRKIAMVSSYNGYDDNGFNMLSKQGLLRLAENYDIELEFKESKQVSDFEPFLLELAKGDADYIFGLGYSMANPMLNVSIAYFEKFYSIIDYKYAEDLNNVTCATFKVDEACFPLGYLAAYFAKTKDPTQTKIAFIGAEETENILAFLNGFNKGVNNYNATHAPVTLVTRYIGSYSDSAKAYQLTRELIDEGVTVFFPPSGESGKGCFKAVSDASLFAIGYDTDCYNTFSQYKSIFLSSCIKRMDNAVYTLGEYYLKNNRNMTTAYLGDLKNEGVGIAPYHDYENQIPDSVKTKILSIIQDIKDKKIVL